MAIKIIESALPKSTAGRKAKPIDTAFAQALADALATSATVELDGTPRPRCLGPETKYETAGKAAGEARRYADAVAAILEVEKVRTRVVGRQNPDGTSEGPYQWTIHLPIAAVTAEAAE